MACIYYGIYPNRGYIGQTTQTVQERGREHIISAFGNGSNGQRLKDEFHYYIRQHGLQPVKQAVFYGPYYGVDKDLLNDFCNSMITSQGPLDPLDAAEILHIMKSVHNHTIYHKLNTSMGGQNTIVKIKQSNGQIIDSLLARSMLPEEAYNRLGMAEVRQADINNYLNRFYKVLFTDEGNDFLNFANSHNVTSDQPSFDMTGDEFIEQHVLSKLELGTENSTGMTDIHQPLHNWIENKFSVIFKMLPMYLDKDKKQLTSESRRNYDWINRNLQKELIDFDSQVSKDLRKKIYKIVGPALTAAKYVYTGKGSLKTYLAKTFFAQINNTKEEISKALSDALRDGIEKQLKASLINTIKLTNSKLAPDSTWGGKFLAGSLSVTEDDCSAFMQHETQRLFNLKIDYVLKKRQSFFERLPDNFYTTYAPEIDETMTFHTRSFRKDNNAIKMAFLKPEDQLYTAVRKQYKDTLFFHKGFEFYRPLVRNGRIQRGRGSFSKVSVTHHANYMSDNEYTHAYEGIVDESGDQQGRFLLYRGEHLLDNDTTLTFY